MMMSSVQSSEEEEFEEEDKERRASKRRRRRQKKKKKKKRRQKNATTFVRRALRAMERVSRGRSGSVVVQNRPVFELFWGARGGSRVRLWERRRDQSELLRRGERVRRRARVGAHVRDANQTRDASDVCGWTRRIHRYRGDAKRGDRRRRERVGVCPRPPERDVVGRPDVCVVYGVSV